MLKQFDQLRKKKVPSSKKLARLSKIIKKELVQKYHELSTSGWETHKIKVIKTILQHEWKVQVD
jgi:hypothetical protein